jgi:hypothetical protein
VNNEANGRRELLRAPADCHPLGHPTVCVTITRCVGRSRMSHRRRPYKILHAGCGADVLRNNLVQHINPRIEEVEAALERT